MSDLISRQWLMECVNEGWIKFETEKDTNKFIHLVRDTAPSVENKGEWIMRGGRIRCKKCDSLAPIITDWEDGCTVYKYTRTQYCPNCGADMRGET